MAGPIHSKICVILAFLCWISHASATLEWHLLNNGTGGLAPIKRQDAAIGFNAIKNQIIIFGGRTTRNSADSVLGDTFIYEINKDEWYQLLALDVEPEARYGAVYGSSGDYFYLATGRGRNNMYFDDIWRFNFRTSRWEKLQNQRKPSRYSDAQWSVREESSLGPEPRYSAAGGIFPNSSRFYLSLGFSDVSHKDTFSYSIPELSWYRESVDLGPYHPRYPHARYLHAGTMISEDELLIFGGCLSGDGTGGACPASDSWVFNGKTKTWHNMGSCASPRTSASLAMLPTKDGERRVLLYGGMEEGPGWQVLTTVSSPKNQVAILNPDTGDWALGETTGDIPSKRSSVSMVTGKKGIYLFGGYDIEMGSERSDLYLLISQSNEADEAPLSAKCNPTFFSLIILHGVLMVLAWGFFLPWGAFIARYMKHRNPLWFNLHKLFQIFGVLLAIGGFVCAVLSVQNGHFKLVHAIVGLTTMVIAIIQPFSALLRPHAPNDNEKKSVRRFLWEISHAFIGRSGICLGLANISLGVFLAHSVTIIWAIWFGYLGFILLTNFIAEITYTRRQLKEKKPESNRRRYQNGNPVKNTFPPNNNPTNIFTNHDASELEL